MDAKWNWFIDNMAVRTALIVSGFCAWLAASAVLLKM
jgi:hypothetical protein